MISFKPASEFTDRHGLFVALVGGTNSGKSFSALRLARGIAGPKGRIAAIDTEGGRLLHLKRDFDFDIALLEPPHRPMRYAEAAEAAEQAGYDALLIDSFSMEWRGVGGVLDWMDEEMSAIVERSRARAREKGWNFDEEKVRFANKSTASITPKMSHKLMVTSLLQRRIPIIFSIRGEETYDPETKKATFKPQCSSGFLFEVTLSFRLATDRKGIIDLSDKTTFKMEGIHEHIFHHGEQLSEHHGAQLARWARGEVVGQPAAQPGASIDLAALVEEADAAVERGNDAYAAFWGRLSKDEKRALLADHETRKARAAQAGQAPANDDDFPGDRPSAHTA